MGIKIISKGTSYWESAYEHMFKSIPYDGSFRSFPCDQEGILLSSLSDQNKALFQECLLDSTMEDIGIHVYKVKVKTDTIGKCDCGEQITLIEVTNFCVCGRYYNLSGQQLAPLSQWGEETGETAAEILSYDGSMVEY